MFLCLRTTKDYKGFLSFTTPFLLLPSFLSLSATASLPILTIFHMRICKKTARNTKPRLAKIAIGKNRRCFYIIKINSRPIFFSRNPPHNQKKKKKCLRDCYARQGDASKLALFEALDPRNTLRPKLTKDSRMRRFILESFSHKGQSSSKSSSTLLCQFLCVTYKAVQV